MAEKQTSRNIINITEEAVKKFINGVYTTQNGILRRINGLLRQLELSGDQIKPNQANIRLLNKIRAAISSIVVNASYKRRVDDFTKNFTRIKSETDKLYKKTNSSFNPNKPLYKDILRSNIALTQTSLLETGINQNVVNPMLRIIEQGITSGMQIGEMEETLRTVIVGDSKRLGGLERYVTQITRDALNQYSRNYNQSISATLDMHWYYYSGSIIEDTRSYCRERAGKYFHKKEVEDVPSQWSGRIPGTNSSTIFTFAGGYNCRHLWLPVLIDVVPKSVIDRNILNGNYMP